MQNKPKIWRFAGPLRFLVLAMVSIYSLYFCMIWALAWLGETEAAFDFVDVASTAPLKHWQIIGGMICSGVAFGAMGVIAFAANRFLKLTKRDGFFINDAAKACRHMGYGLILFWVGLILWENFMPWIITHNLPEEQQEEIIWFLLDPNIIALLVGFILILMAQAIDEARAIDEDNKQII